MSSPDASRSMVAPTGSGVSLPMPNARNAALFSTEAWPDRWASLTGLRGAASSSSHRVGARPSVRWNSS